MSGQNRLRDLEKRLRDEPDNLGLRVVLAGALREVGRIDEAVELYRSVAMAYRDQGRTQQAIAVCRSILDIVPGDPISTLLLDQLGGKPSAMTIEPVRRSSRSDATPLPRPVPYHVADPTTASLQKLSAKDILDIPTLAEGTDPPPAPSRLRPSTDSGLANAARRISRELSRDASYEDLEMDLASELSTRRIQRLPTSAEEAKLAAPPPAPSSTTVKFVRPDDDVDDIDEDAATPVPNELDTLEEDEHTEPFDLLGSRTRTQRGSARQVSPFFAPLPDGDRQAVLGRFIPRTVPVGTLVIRQGEHGHPLVIVARGRLDIRVERKDGVQVQVGTIAAGEYIGEASLLARGAAPAHVIAASEAELLLLAPKAFYEVASAYPALWAELKDAAERRRRELEARLRR